MARIRGRAGYKPQTYKKTEVLQWLRTLPIAPEFYPTIEEFQDPISYIHKIEKHASVYGLCKIIPPVLLPSTKTTILELEKSFLACCASPEGELKPAFTTRVQQVGYCSEQDHPVIKSVRESGKSYTLSEFEAKAKSFEDNYFKKISIDKAVSSSLDIETIYWNANADQSIDVESAIDMPGSAFVELDKRRGAEGFSDNLNVGDSAWNLRGTARAERCPLRFVKGDIPGVTSPMVYIGMMFSWFGWHVHDHDLHSLNYMHLGDGKTWYGVPKDAAIKFEEVIMNHGYGGQMNPTVTYATLAKKNTVMSPEVIVNAGIPCYRLVQNAGEFVVTFPRAYHSGFSHGFNCAEASNITTAEWLRCAREAAIRRAAANCPPLVSEMGADLIWSDISFKKATEKDWEIIKSASRFNSEGSIHGNADWAAKLGVNLFYSDATPERASKSQTIYLSSEAALKRKRMDDIELTSKGKSPEVKESIKATEHALKARFGIKYKRTFKNKLKKNIIQEETPQHEKNQDQWAGQVDRYIETVLEEGGPSTRLRPGICKQPAKLECTKRAKRTLGIQVSGAKRAKRSKAMEFSCKIEGCTMKFDSKQELVQHEENSCSVQGCRKKFASHKYLRQHQKVHLDDRPLKCSWKGCKKTFKWAWARTEHLRVHTGERPYTCDETGCGKTFRFVSDVSRHKRKTGHSGKLQESASKGKKKTK